MQHVVSRPGPDANLNNRGNNRTQIILIVALALFSLSGMTVGFATGAFTRLNQAQQPIPKHTNTSMAHSSPTSIPTQTVQPVALGCPIVKNYSALGIDNYTLTAQAVDTSNGLCTQGKPGKPLHNTGITGKIWLAHIPDNKGKTVTFPHGTKFTLEAIKQPLPGELPDTLVFDPTINQIQTSNDQGQITWRFTISPTVMNGQYYIVIFNDWDGTYVNWSWIQISVKGVE